MSKLANKVAIVTGGSRGIGAAIAKRLAAEHALPPIQADSIDADAIKGAVAKRVEAFGSLDILVSNAGTLFPKPFEEGTIEEFDHVITLNVRGVIIATQAALKHLNNGGRIITIGSCVGERDMTPGLAVYSATKGAVKMFTQGLSREVGGRGITVNNVQPGPIDEPSVGLAPILVGRMMDKISELSAQLGLTVLMAEQNFEQATRIANAGYVLVHGQVALAAENMIFRESAVMRELYLGRE